MVYKVNDLYLVKLAKVTYQSGFNIKWKQTDNRWRIAKLSYYDTEKGFLIANGNISVYSGQCFLLKIGDLFVCEKQPLKLYLKENKLFITTTTAIQIENTINVLE